MASAAISSLSLSLQYSPAESSTCRAVVVGEPLVYQFIKGEFLPGSDKKVDSQSGSWSMNNHMHNHIVDVHGIPLPGTSMVVNSLPCSSVDTFILLLLLISSIALIFLQWLCTSIKLRIRKMW